jgi:universal stress protein E
MERAEWDLRIVRMFKKVLVLADGDDPNHPALQRALSLVAPGGEIEVLAVVYEPMLDAYLGNKGVHGPLRRRVLDERQARAAALARALESEGVHGVAKAVWSHPMHRAVADEVVAEGSDLVVAAPANLHGALPGTREGLTHADWQVVATCPAPLLLVCSDGRAPYRHVAAAVDPFHSYAKPENLDREILRHAQGVCALSRAALSVVHCYMPIDYFGEGLVGAPAGAPAAAQARAEALAALCAEAHVEGADTRIVPGVPHVVLHSMQQGGEADLVVMGVLARGRLKELILGNTAERVLHGSAGDMLLIKPASVRG